MSWFDDPWTWDKAQGRQLGRLLGGLYATDDATAKLLEDIGAQDLMKYEGSPELRWGHILRQGHGRRRLRAVLSAIADQPGNEALAEIFAGLGAPSQLVAHGNPVDPYQVRLLGPQRLPLVDRASLRAHVRLLVEQQYPVLVIRDAPSHR